MPRRPDGQPSAPDDQKSLIPDSGWSVRDVVLHPAVLLVAGMAVLSLIVHRSRLALDLAGGRLLSPEGLGETWSSYLAAWHPVGGGSAAPAPAALAVLGLLGAPFGSPAVAVSLLVLAAMPLAALSAYIATAPLPVSRGARALAAAGYALLPPAVAGVAQGRLDVVLAAILLPLVLSGTALVLRGGSPTWSASWLPISAVTALGLAVISAFAPLLHLMVLAVVLLGFVLVPAPKGATMRRAIGLFAVVLLPLGLLMPWPAVVVQRPSVLLHGVGAVVPEQVPTWLELLTLDPGGAGAAAGVGAVVLLGAVLALVLRPTAAMLPGLGIAALGAAAAVVLAQTPVQPLPGGDLRPGFTGAALLFAACGLLWVALLAGRRDGSPAPRWLRLTGTGLPYTGVAVLAVAAVLAGASGPLTPGGKGDLPVLASSLAAELERDGTSVLVVGEEGEPVRLTRDRTPRFGDDDIAPLRSTIARLDRVAEALRTGTPEEATAAVTNVAALGVEFIVLPSDAQADRILEAAGPLAQQAPATEDGKPVVRVSRPIPGAELLGPALAEQARAGAAPPIEKGVTGVLVDSGPPTVAAEVAPGAEGRLLVVAANDEPGWRATVDGEDVPVVRGWGYQVAVAVPAASSEVRVDRSEVARTMLLLAQLGILLLVVGTAIPGRRKRTS